MTEQAPELIYEGQIQKVSVVMPQATKEKPTDTQDNTSRAETDAVKETAATDTHSAESEESKSINPSNTNETLAENRETEGPEASEVSERSTAADEVIKPFSLPSVASDPVFDRSHKAILPQYTTDASGTYPTASWQPTGIRMCATIKETKTELHNGMGKRNGTGNQRTKPIPILNMVGLVPKQTMPFASMPKRPRHLDYLMYT